MSFEFKLENGDIKIDNGDIVKLQNEQKLVQDIIKNCILPIKGNPHHTNLGCGINRTMVGAAYDPEFTYDMSDQQIRNTLDTIQQLQKIQAQYQYLSPGEQLAAINNIMITRNTTDPRYYSTVINVLTKSLSNISPKFDINPI